VSVPLSATAKSFEILSNLTALGSPRPDRPDGNGLHRKGESSYSATGRLNLAPNSLSRQHGLLRMLLRRSVQITAAECDSCLALPGKAAHIHVIRVQSSARRWV